MSGKVWIGCMEKKLAEGLLHFLKDGIQVRTPVFKQLVKIACVCVYVCLCVSTYVGMCVSECMCQHECVVAG